MATTRHELIDELLITRRQAQRLAISLRFQGDTAATAAAEKENELTGQIDRLLAKEMEAWIEPAREMTIRLKSINQRLATNVESVRTRSQKARYIAGALGALDDVLRMIRRLGV